MPRVLAAFLQMQGQAAQPGAPEAWLPSWRESLGTEGLEGMLGGLFGRGCRRESPVPERPGLYGDFASQSLSRSPRRDRDRARERETQPRDNSRSRPTSSSRAAS